MQSKLITTFDHIIFSSYHLENGVNFIYEKLGVRPQKGGQHLTMGTHNAVLRLEDTTYLEVISIDPILPAPLQPRWFGMDNILPDSEPKLLTWVVRTNDIHKAVSGSKVPQGKINGLKRGIYEWQIAIPEDGHLPMQGVAPTIIQWQSKAHPAHLLPACGVSLKSLEAFHSNAHELDESLKAIGYKGECKTSVIGVNDVASLIVTLESPKGLVTFQS